LVSVWRASAGTVGREDARTRSLGESKSRNKVSVGEPAEGSLKVATSSVPITDELRQYTHNGKHVDIFCRLERRSARSAAPAGLTAPLSGYLVVLDAIHGDGLEPQGSPGREVQRVAGSVLYSLS
jgi:hypothetical protein